MYDATMPQLDPKVVTERFNSLLIKYGPASNDGTVVRTMPMQSVVGEMCRQLLCLVAEFDEGSTYFDFVAEDGLPPSETFRELFEKFLVDECHSPGVLIWQFLPSDLIGLFGFAADYSLPLPNKLICQIASEIVGYHDLLRDMEGGAA